MQTGKIDETILSYFQHPSIFGDNVWNCYSECKLQIPYVEHHEYMKYIDYITDMLQL